MDADFLLAVIMIITVTAIIGGSVNGVVQKVLDYKKSKLAMMNSHSAPPIANQSEERTDLIEERLRVLERIATDRGQTLADEIESLRAETRLAPELERTK